MAEVLHEKDEATNVLRKEDHQKDEDANALRNIDELIDESVQNYELDKEKSNVVDELINSLKIISRYVKVSVDISPSLLNLAPSTKISITPDLELMIIDSSNKCVTKELSELTLNELVTILAHYIPTLTNTVKVDRESKNKKMTHLRDVSIKLKNIHKLKLDPTVEKTTPSI